MDAPASLPIYLPGRSSDDMILGILSDSHGDADATSRAVELLRGRGAELFIHCGDICGIGVLDVLAGLNCRFVWGNCDHPDAAMRKYVRDIGLPLPEGDLTFELDGKVFAVFHGHEDGFHSAVESGQFDYILHGHTHRYADSRVSRTRVINPGALHRARPHTVATLDLSTDKLTVLRIDTGQPI